MQNRNPKLSKQNKSIKQRSKSHQTKILQKSNTNQFYFNPYHINISQHLSSLKFALRRLATLQHEQKLQKISIDINYVVQAHPSYQEECLNIMMILFRLKNKFLLNFKKNLLKLIIDHCESVDDNLAISMLQFYFKLNNSILIQLNIKIFFMQLQKYTSNKILWSIIMHLMQQQQQHHNTDQTVKFINRFIDFLHWYQIPEHIQMINIFEYFKRTIDLLIKNKIKFNLVKIADFSLHGKTVEIFQRITQYIKSIATTTPQNYLFTHNIITDLIDNSTRNYSQLEKLIVILVNHPFLFNIIQYKPNTQQFTRQELQLFATNIFNFGVLCDYYRNNSQLQKLVIQLKKISYGHNWQTNQCQSILYRLLFMIQKNILNHQFTFYEDCYLQNPIIFQQGFYCKLLQTNSNKANNSLVKKFLNKYTKKKQINLIGNIKFYIMRYLEHSIDNNCQQQLKQFILILEFEDFIQLNLIIYRQSFENLPQKRRQQIPKLSNINMKQSFSQLASCGMSENTIFIDRYFDNRQENILWKQLLNQIETRNDYFTIKYFYSFLREVFESVGQQGNLKMQQLLVKSLENNLNKTQLVEFSANFHLLMIFLFNYRPHAIVERLIFLFYQNYQKIDRMYDETYNERNSCMRFMTLSNEDLINNRKMLNKCRKMHKNMLKNWHKFFELLNNKIIDYVPHKIPYEQLFQKFMQITKSGENNELSIYNSMRVLTNKCSKKMFLNIAHEKITAKNKNYNDLMIYREVIKGIYSSQNKVEIKQLFQLGPKNILKICLDKFKQQIQLSTQRQILKCKLIICQIFRTMKLVADKFPIFKIKFLEKIKQIKQLTFRIIKRDIVLIGKYQRDLIIHIRSYILNWYLEDIQTQYSIISQQQIWCLLAQLTVDESYQIKLLIYNALFSVHKQQYKYLRKKFHYTVSIATLMHCFDPNYKIKKLTYITLKHISQNIELSPLIVITLSFFLTNFPKVFNWKMIVKEFLAIWQRKQCQAYIFVTLSQLINRKYSVRQFQSSINKLKNFGQQQFYDLTKNQQDNNNNENVNIFEEFIQGIKNRNKNGSKLIKMKKDIIIDWNKIKQLNLLLIN